MLALKRIALALAVLGGSLIVLFWVMGLASRYLPAPISTIAGRAESLMQPH